MPKTYKHLSAEERDILAVLKSKGRSIRQIAKVLKRSPSTLSRELKRNAPPVYKGYYLAHRAQQRADIRKHQSHLRQRLKNDFIRDYVQKHIRLGWSPELLAGRLNIEHPDQCISHQAIYQYIYMDATHLISLWCEPITGVSIEDIRANTKSHISTIESQSVNVRQRY